MIEFEPEFSSEHAMSSDRYSENGNLTLKSGAAVVATHKTGPVLAQKSGLDRSSSGSSHGSGHSGGTNSSGYVSEETKVIQEHCQVEIEESDQEQSEAGVVTVTGGLQLGPKAISSQVRTFWQNKDKHSGKLMNAQISSELHNSRLQILPGNEFAKMFAAASCKVSGWPCERMSSALKLSVYKPLISCIISKRLAREMQPNSLKIKTSFTDTQTRHKRMMSNYDLQIDLFSDN